MTVIVTNEWITKRGEECPTNGRKQHQGDGGDAPRQVAIVVQDPTSVVVEVCRQEKPGRLLVHLANCVPGTPLKDVSVKLPLAGAEDFSSKGRGELPRWRKRTNQA